MQGCGQSPGSARCCRSMNTKNRSNGGYTSTRCKSTRQRRCSCPRSMAKTAKVTTVGSGRCEGPCLAETLYIYHHISFSSTICSPSIAIGALRVDPWILPGGNAILGIDEIPRWKLRRSHGYHGATMEALKIAMCLEEIMNFFLLGLTRFNHQNIRI